MDAKIQSRRIALIVIYSVLALNMVIILSLFINNFVESIKNLDDISLGYFSIIFNIIIFSLVFLGYVFAIKGARRERFYIVSSVLLLVYSSIYVFIFAITITSDGIIYDIGSILYIISASISAFVFSPVCIGLSIDIYVKSKILARQRRIAQEAQNRATEIAYYNTPSISTANQEIDLEEAQNEDIFEGSKSIG